ncbi:MAG: carbohydrate ABC transporter permease [Victivallaceae bacterium]|nr:carbohydrate ABC transporter permease [Victivallaceae bacterium]
MSIISKGGRRSLKVRLIFTGIYTILIAGTITMVYPFLLMLSSSVTSAFDFDDLRIVPEYLANDDALVKKHLYAKYGIENFRHLGIIYRRDADWSIWGTVRGEKNFIRKNYMDIAKRYERYSKQCLQELADWNEFKKTLPAQDVAAFFPNDYDDYRNFLKKKYSGKSGFSNKSDAIARLNNRWQRAFNNFAEILPLRSFLTEQQWFPPRRPDFDDLLAYQRQLPAERIKVIPTRLLWALYLEKRFVNISKFAKQTGIEVKQFSDVPIPAENNRSLYPVWLDFLLKKYPLRLVRINGDYENVTAPEDPIKRRQWLDFVLTKVPVEKWQLNRPLDLYRSFLCDKHKNIAALNNAYAGNYKSFNEIELPLKLADYVEFAENKSNIRWAFFTENYKKVIGFLITKGRAIWVTIFLVGLTILGALTVNPLAAYALSRGKQSTSAKILIFFLVTMAFPAEVAMIPGFLLLRELNLLNTFGALVLPGLANAYSIFLLKGFFDSVPKELYEAADIDGAGELTKFWRITFPMSKPILAVIALNAFVLSYGGFMWAFLTCQDPNMWTIMVWLYDFQSCYAAEPGMCMAAFTLSSIPTLLVFLFCQKIIMQGIVIPTMK